MSRDADILNEGRRRERTQTLFYRSLSAAAESAGDAATAERLNELLADEQHHVSRLTARLLEGGEKPDEAFERPAVPSLAAWEAPARARETDEVDWYEAALERVEDADTRAVLQEILDSERHHRRSLGGKWMSAAHDDHEGEP